MDRWIDKAISLLCPSPTLRSSLLHQSSSSGQEADGGGGGGSSSSSDSDSDAPRSAISGKKIKMKLDRGKDDKQMEKGRKDFLRFINSQFD